MADPAAQRRTTLRDQLRYGPIREGYRGRGWRTPLAGYLRYGPIRERYRGRGWRLADPARRLPEVWTDTGGVPGGVRVMVDPARRLPQYGPIREGVPG